MRKSKLTIILALAAALGFFVQSPAVADSDVVKIVASHSRKCLEPFGIIALGAPVLQSGCWEGNLSQQWVFVEIAKAGSSVLVNIVQPATGLCLTVTGAWFADGAGVVQLPCADSARHQTWIVPAS